MITFSGRTKIYAATHPVDLRKSYDALFAYIRDVTKQDPMSGHVFLFINNRRDRLKAMLWDGTGLVLLCKKLEQGHFTRFNSYLGDSITMTSSEFALLFEGADLTKRFVESPKKYREMSKNS
jgi:transposase